jgi:hypothetical protein
VIIHDGSVVATGTRESLVADWIPGRDGELEEVFFAAIRTGVAHSELHP